MRILTIPLDSIFLPTFCILIFYWGELTSWPHYQDIPKSSYFSLSPTHIIKQGDTESWKNQKSTGKILGEGLEKQVRDVFWTDSTGEARNPGREERVKSFPLQYKRKECAERLGFLLLQWELQKRREEAEEKKGGVSPLKTCRDWERKRESQGQRIWERGHASLSVCLSLGRENTSASQWIALGKRH